MRRLLVAAAALFLSVASVAQATTNCTIYYQLDGEKTKSVTNVNQQSVQAVLDLATPTRKLFIQQSIGNLDTDSTLWFHGNTWWFGQGKGLSTITRTRLNASDPAYHGDLINSARWGMHTPNLGLTGNVPTDSLANITITGVTLDGNISSIPGVDPLTFNPNTCNNFGAQFWFVDNLTIRDVEIKNTFQTGIEFDACRNVKMVDSWVHDVGKEVMIGTRNGVNFNNNSGNLVVSQRWARDMTIDNCTIDNHRDTMIDCANVSDVTISNIRSTCDFDSIGNLPGQASNMVFEFEGSISGYTMRNFEISNIVARGHRSVFFTKGGSGPPLDGLKMSNLDFWAGDSSKGVAISLGAGAGGVRNVNISNGTFRNLNGKNFDGVGATCTFLYCYSNGDTIRDVTLQNLTFIGAHGETYHSSNRGAQIGGNAYRIMLDNCKFVNSEGDGVAVIANGSDVAREITVQNCMVDGARQLGFVAYQSGVTGKLNGIRFYRNVAKDTNKEQSGYAFRAVATTGDVRNVWFLHNKVIRTSGSTMQGLQLFQSGAAVLDSAWVVDNELQGAATSPYTTSGTVTNVYLKDPAAGAAANNLFDNNTWLYWRNAANSAYLPVAKMDSLNTLRFQAQTNGTIDFYRSDGTLSTRISGANGDLNVTNNSRYVLNGFPLLKDNSNERRLVLKSALAGTGGWFAVRDSADANNLSILTDRFGDGWISGSWNVGDTLNVTGAAILGSRTFANLGTPANGTLYYCTDCTASNPTTGSGSGVVVRREGGVWNSSATATIPDPLTKGAIIATDSLRVGTSASARNLTVSGALLSYGNIHTGFGGINMNVAGGSNAEVMRRVSTSVLAIEVPSSGGQIGFRDFAGNAYPFVIGDGGVTAWTKPIAFSALPAVTDGTMTYCNDCTQTNPCAGSGGGAFARREAGAWNCGATGTAPITGSFYVNYDLSGGSASQDTVVTMSGATVGMAFQVGWAKDISNADATGMHVEARCFTTNQVTLRAFRECSATPNPNAILFKVVGQ